MDERFIKIIKHPVTIPGVVGLLAFGGGFAAGAAYIRKKLKQEEGREVVEQLVIDYKSQYPDIFDKSEFPEVVVKDEEPEGLWVEYVIPEEAGEPVDIPSPSSIWASTVDDWDMEEEAKDRTEEAPYVLHKDEFWSEESGYSQTTLTWYEGDEIMCDQEDHPIYNYEAVVGPLKFGHGTTDTNCFYVRNDSMKAEYEIIRSKSHYSVEVLGLAFEQESEAQDLKHSRVLKFRSE